MQQLMRGPQRTATGTIQAGERMKDATRIKSILRRRKKIEQRHHRQSSERHRPLNHKMRFCAWRFHNPVVPNAGLRVKLAKKNWNPSGDCLTSPHISVREFMKAKIIVTPKKAVLDPQGKTVQNALEHMGYKGVGAVHVGKYLEIELPDGDKDSWRKQIDDACHKILSNPVIEDYKFEIE